jgi:hypothetical protein
MSPPSPKFARRHAKASAKVALKYVETRDADPRSHFFQRQCPFCREQFRCNLHPHFQEQSRWARSRFDSEQPG